MVFLVLDCIGIGSDSLLVKGMMMNGLILLDLVVLLEYMAY